MISGYHREIDENCALLGFYAASSGLSLPTFRDNLLVLSSGLFLELLTREDGTDSLSEMLIRNFRYTLHNNPEERRYQDDISSYNQEIL
jgi:hypothetical protein